MATLYENLQQICDEKHLNFSKLAKISGVSAGTLYDLQAGRKKTITISTAKKLATALNVSVDYLMNGNDNIEEKDNEDLSVLLSEIKKRLKDNDNISFDGKLVTAQGARLLLNSLDMIENMAKDLAEERDNKKGV